MEENKKGGKRVNSGRKPLSDPKKPITLYIPKGIKFPMVAERSLEAQKEGYMSGFKLNNLAEAIFLFYHHELRHRIQDQTKLKDMPRMGFRKDRYSETDCEIYALKMLEKWRNK